ncbi:MAG: GIDE domain-containing protein [Terriglobales bacterium]
MGNIGKIAALAISSVSSASPEPLQSPLVWGIAGIAIGVFLFFRGFPFLKRKQLIQDIPTSTVRGASLGAVEVSGRVVGPYTLIAPLSETDCFYYRAVGRGSSKEEKDPREEILYAPFFLDDGTGRVMVDPRGAETELRATVDDDYSPSSGDAFTRHFLVRHGISSSLPAHLEEYCIRAGDQLYVLATLRENPGLQSAADCLAGGVVQREQGFLSTEAADLQRRAAIESMLPPGSAPPRIPQDRPAETEVFDLNPPVVLMKGTSGQPFFISCRSQREVIQELAWRSALYIWGGPMLALAGLWLIVDYLLAH